MDRSQAKLPDDARREAGAWMYSINTDDTIPGRIIGYANDLHAVMHVTPDLYNAIQTGRVRRENFPTQLGGYPVHFHVLPGRPIPFAKTEDGETLQEKLFPLDDLQLGVISAGFRNIEGGYQMVVTVTPKCNRQEIQRIIDRYATGRDVQIVVASDYGSRH